MDAAIRWPSLTSSPYTRRWPHVGFSVAMRITSLRIAAAVDGRPGGRRLVSSQWRATSRRCQASSVAGVTAEHLAPALPGDQPRQRREPQPVSRLIADPADLAAYQRNLMPHNQQPGVRCPRMPGPHHQAAEQASHDQVDDREDHPAMMYNRAGCRGEIE